VGPWTSGKAALMHLLAAWRGDGLPSVVDVKPVVADGSS
jgi:hypothetical protein